MHWPINEVAENIDELKITRNMSTWGGLSHGNLIRTGQVQGVKK